MSSDSLEGHVSVPLSINSSLGSPLSPLLNTSSSSASFSSTGCDETIIQSLEYDKRYTTNTLSTMSSALRTILECLGENPEREGLIKTPLRAAKALLAITSGYLDEPIKIVSDAMFDAGQGVDEMVIVRDISFHSMCEHHMLPFYGQVNVAYIPQGKVVGLSKIARIVDCFSKRLQIQERLTSQIADAIELCVGAKGVAVCVEACHMCMSMRGVGKLGAITTSFAYNGMFKNDRTLRMEFLVSIKQTNTTVKVKEEMTTDSTNDRTTC
jgi:GTP cyclohydrolase IA